jgi:hypothetical protein
VTPAMQEVVDSPPYEFGHFLLLSSIKMTLGGFPRDAFLALWNHPNSPEAIATLPADVVEEIENDLARREARDVELSAL